MTNEDKVPSDYADKKDVNVEDAPETAESVDEEDVKSSLERTTFDGKGDDDPGDSDFQSFANENAEVEDGVGR
jgi:hypothetical protein